MKRYDSAGIVLMGALTLAVSIPAKAIAGAPVTSPLIAATPAGKVINISTVPGWRVVYFWAASCPWVKACERYSFKPLAAKYKGRVSFFAVSSDGWDLSMPRGQMLQHIDAHHLPYPILLDTKHTIALALHAQVTPETFVLDPAGRVVFAGMPEDCRNFNWKPSRDAKNVPQTYLSKALAEALAGQAVTNSPLLGSGLRRGVVGGRYD